MSSLTPIAALRQADREFSSRLALVSESAWVAPSVCDEWSVGDLVDHVVGGNLFTIEILGGADVDTAMGAAIEGATSGASRRRDAYERSAGEMLGSFASGDAQAASYRHVGGTMSGAEVAALRTEDITLHAWDLANSIDAEDRINPALVEFVWDRMSLRVHELEASGRYGTGRREELGSGASLQASLLHITGRNPSRSLD